MKPRKKGPPDKADHRPTGHSSKKSLPEGTYLVEGIAAIQEYLRYKPKDVKRIFVKEKQLAHYRDLLPSLKIPLDIVSESASPDSDTPATRIWAHVHHAMLDITEFERILPITYATHGAILALDHISDPRNLGAIIRSAAFFGVKHVIVPERRQVLLTQSAVNTAQGGFALTDLIVVVNLSRTLEMLKDHGFWILGTTMDGDTVESLRGKYEKQILVLGSEDKGISPGVLSRCDLKMSIAGAKTRLDSLNVSVAAGIFLQRLVVND